MGGLRERNVVCDHGSEVLVKCPEGQGPGIPTLEANVEKKKNAKEMYTSRGCFCFAPRYLSGVLSQLEGAAEKLLKSSGLSRLPAPGYPVPHPTLIGVRAHSLPSNNCK